MTQSQRLFVWAGGAMFVTSLATCAYYYLVVWAGPVPGDDALGAIAFNVLLLTVFAAHHSAFAREGPKQWIHRVVPQQLLRSVYVWIASVLLIIVCVAWRRIGGEIWNVDGPVAMAHAALQLAGVWLIARAVGGLDPLELAGIHPARPSDGLKVDGAYRWVRHPLYLGWMMAVFGAAHMTGDRLAFAAITSIYLVVAVPWEERSLVQSFGEDYMQYRRRVRWRIIPFIY